MGFFLLQLLFFDRFKGLYLGADDEKACWQFDGIRWCLRSPKQLQGDIQRDLRPLMRKFINLGKVELDLAYKLKEDGDEGKGFM